MTDWMTRRDLLRSAAAGSLALLGSRATAAAPRPLGVQLYTVRDVIMKDPAATLEAIAGIGYTGVEVIRSTLDVVAPAARAAGLKPVSVHLDTPIVTGDWAPWREAAKHVPMTLPPEGYDLAAAIRDAKSAGARYVVLPYLLPTERKGTAEYYTTLADTLNRAGEQVREAGLQLCYHNHAFEFEPLDDGRRPLDVLMASLKPELVKLELDVFWVAVAGADPVALVRQYAGRIALMHLKDKTAGAPRETQEMRVPATAFAEVGSGTLDFPAILEAARAAGVEHYFVEQDHTAGDPIASLRKSFGYLSRLD